MNHAKLVQTSSGLAYATGHHWDHLLGVHLLRDHPLLVLLLLGAPESQPMLGIANADINQKRKGWGPYSSASEGSVVIGQLLLHLLPHHGLIIAEMLIEHE